LSERGAHCHQSGGASSVPPSTQRQPLTELPGRLHSSMPTSSASMTRRSTASLSAVRPSRNVSRYQVGMDRYDALLAQRFEIKAPTFLPGRAPGSPPGGRARSAMRSAPTHRCSAKSSTLPFSPDRELTDLRLLSATKARALASGSGTHDARCNRAGGIAISPE
jgi:hypothetical protein